MKVIVVGINHAGTSAIRTLLTQNPNHEVHAYDRNDNISFLGCGIALTVSGVVKNTEDLFYSNPKQLQGMGAKIFMRHEVLSINPEKKTVVVRNLDTNQNLEDSYDKLILAAGSWPITPPGTELPFQQKYCGNIKNLVSCKTYQHALEIIKQVSDPAIKSVVVVGAGYIGIELAEAALKRGKKVTLIDMLDAPAANYYDKEFTDALSKSMAKHGINLMMNTKVAEYLVDANNAVTGVKTSSGEVIEAQLVMMVIGFFPNNQLLPSAKKVDFGNGREGAYIVDEYARTSVKDIYALGDNAAFLNAATGKYQNVALATNAVKSGVVAASHINGVDAVKIPSVVGTNAICVFGWNLASTGVSEATAKRWGMNVASSYFEDADRPEFMNDYGKVKIKIVFDKDTLRLVGAQIASEGEISHTETIYYLALAIQKQMSIIELALTDVYFLPHYNKPFNFVLSAIMQALSLNYFNKAK